MNAADAIRHGLHRPGGYGGARRVTPKPSASCGECGWAGKKKKKKPKPVDIKPKECCDPLGGNCTPMPASGICGTVGHFPTYPRWLASPSAQPAARHARRRVGRGPHAGPPQLPPPGPKPPPPKPNGGIPPVGEPKPINIPPTGGAPQPRHASRGVGRGPARFNRRGRSAQFAAGKYDACGPDLMFQALDEYGDPDPFNLTASGNYACYACPGGWWEVTDWGTTACMPYGEQVVLVSKHVARLPGRGMRLGPFSLPTPGRQPLPPPPGRQPLPPPPGRQPLFAFPKKKKKKKKKPGLNYERCLEMLCAGQARGPTLPLPMPAGPTLPMPAGPTLPMPAGPIVTPGPQAAPKSDIGGPCTIHANCWDPGICIGGKCVHWGPTTPYSRFR